MCAAQKPLLLKSRVLAGNSADPPSTPRYLYSLPVSYCHRRFYSPGRGDVATVLATFRPPFWRCEMFGPPDDLTARQHFCQQGSKVWSFLRKFAGFFLFQSSFGAGTRETIRRKNPQFLILPACFPCAGPDRSNHVASLLVWKFFFSSDFCRFRDFGSTLFRQRC